ncbi:MAG: GNAT family N-acetyltransferase [Spirochaetaceae bacterium]|nr:MAG: GNAT family N-acetyltransferase [Spirochaetaceae bacterium]
MLCAVTDKDLIFRFLSRQSELHIYELGDLEDDYFAHTQWYAWDTEGVEALALLYTAQKPATLIAIEDHVEPAYERLLEALLPGLPNELNVHVSPRLAFVFEAAYPVRSCVEHLKMIWRGKADDEPGASEGLLPAGMSLHRLEAGDIPALRDLYAAGYPRNWFDADMFAHGRYFGVRHGEALIAAAGTHVCAPSYGVAAIGNVATHPDYRGRRLARVVSAALCASLSRDVAHIGLNVHAANHAAIAVYRTLGFVDVTRYCELQLSR